MSRITLFQKPPSLPPLPVSLLTEVAYALGCGRKDGNSGNSRTACNCVARCLTKGTYQSAWSVTLRHIKTAWHKSILPPARKSLTSKTKVCIGSWHRRAFCGMPGTSERILLTAQSRGIILQTFETTCFALFEAAACLLLWDGNLFPRRHHLRREPRKMHLSAVARGWDPSACLREPWLQAGEREQAPGQATAVPCRAAHTAGRWRGDSGEGEASSMFQGWLTALV